jgi:hypothetical protein
VRSLSSALLLLAVAGCATPPPPAPEGPPPPRSALARAAHTEWEDWGRVTITGWSLARPDDVAATPARFERLLEYWYAIPGGGQVALRHARVRAMMQGGFATLPPADAEPIAPVAAVAPTWEDIGIYAQPAWSAAFVSAMARRAGIPANDLPSSSRHARYIDAALTRWRADPDGAAFVPHAPEDYAPVDGDLLCADRSYAALAHWTMRYASLNRPRPMHCDVVVRTAPGVVEVIGGNVQDLVTLRRLQADADGRVLPPPPGFPPFVLVLAARGERPTTPIPPAVPAVTEMEEELGE